MDKVGIMTMHFLIDKGEFFSESAICFLKFIYSEKATKFCKIFAILLTGTIWDKSKVKISQNFVAFSEYMNFTYQICKLLELTHTGMPKLKIGSTFM